MCVVSSIGGSPLLTSCRNYRTGSAIYTVSSEFSSVLEKKSITTNLKIPSSLDFWYIYKVKMKSIEEIIVNTAFLRKFCRILDLLLLQSG